MSHQLAITTINHLSISMGKGEAHSSRVVALPRRGCGGRENGKLDKMEKDMGKGEKLSEEKRGSEKREKMGGKMGEKKNW